MGEGRIRLVVLGGFLGSGKTTLLARGIEGPGVQVVVNDFAGRSPDLGILGGRATALLGGCGCCGNRAALVALLREICQSRHRRDTAPVDMVALETSGLADPAAIAAAIRQDPVLVSNMVVSEIVVTVDAARGISDLIHEPLARRQVEVADRIVITKADTVAAHQMRRAAATLRRINPGASLSAAACGIASPVPDTAAADAVALPDPGGIAHSDPTSCWIPLPVTVDWDLLTVWLGALLHAHPEQILRLKGLVRTEAGVLLLHAARGVIGLPQRLAHPPGDQQTGLLFVIRDIDPALLRRSWTVIAEALSGRPPETFDTRVNPDNPPIREMVSR